MFCQAAWDAGTSERRPAVGSVAWCLGTSERWAPAGLVLRGLREGDVLEDDLLTGTAVGVAAVLLGAPSQV